MRRRSPTHRPLRRARLGVTAALLALAGCATLGTGEPIEVQLVSLTPLPSTAFEHRLRVDLRLRNPNNRSYEIEGVRFLLDVNGERLASGLSNDRATLPRLGEVVIAGDDHHLAARSREPDRRTGQPAAAALRVRAARQGLPEGRVGQHPVRAQRLGGRSDPAPRANAPAPPASTTPPGRR